MKSIKVMTCAGLMAAGTVAQAETLDMQAYVPGSLPVLGSAGIALGERVGRLTGGELEIVYHNPGELVAASEIWDSVSTGAVPAGWYALGTAEGVIRPRRFSPPSPLAPAQLSIPPGGTRAAERSFGQSCRHRSTSIPSCAPCSRQKHRVGSESRLIRPKTCKASTCGSLAWARQ